MKNVNRWLNGTLTLVMLTAIAVMFLSVQAHAAYRYMDKIQPGVTTMEEVEDEFGPPVESLNATTFKYGAPQGGLEAYVVEYGGQGDDSGDKVLRLDIYMSGPINSKKMAQSLGVSDPVLGAVNSEGQYEEFYGGDYSAIFIHDSDSPESGVVIVSFLTGEGFASLLGEDEAEPSEPDTTVAAEDTEEDAEGSELITVESPEGSQENVDQSGAYGVNVEGGPPDQTVTETAQEPGDQAQETTAAESEEAAREEVAEEAEESTDIADEIESATGVDEAQVIQDEVQGGEAQGDEAAERAQGIEDAAVESGETPEDAPEVAETEAVESEETAEVSETVEEEATELAGGETEAEGEEVATLSPEAKFHMQQGMMYVSLARANPSTESENYSNALLEFSNAINLYPGYTEAYSNRGVIYMHTQKYNLAKRDLQKAAELSPEDPYVQYNLAALYSVRGDLDLSIEALDRSLANGFDNYDALRAEGANSDPDLDNVRQLPEYKQTLEKYKIFIIK